MKKNSPLITLAHISKHIYNQIRIDNTKFANAFSTALILNYIYDNKEVRSQEIYLNIPQSARWCLENLNYLISKGYIKKKDKLINHSPVYYCTEIGTSLIRECEAKKPKKPYVRKEYRKAKN